jgi:hypothetical protein
MVLSICTTVVINMNMLHSVLWCRRRRVPPVVHNEQAWETAMKNNFTNSADIFGLNGCGLEGNWL